MTPASFPAPERQQPPPTGVTMVWIILLGILIGHVCVVVQGLVLPHDYHPWDWLASGMTLLSMLGVALANRQRRYAPRQLLSFMLLVNAVFLLVKLADSLFLHGHSDHILTELATLGLWLLTVPMLAANLRVNRLAQQVSNVLPALIAALAVTFALTPAGRRVAPAVWFGLFQLTLVCLTVVLSSRYVTGVRRALSDSQRRNHLLSRRVFQDELTGLHNRAFLDDFLQRTCQPGSQQALFFIDVDGFKQVNDRFGHATGDEVLRAVADRLKKGVPEASCVVRVSGDEFVLVLPTTDTPQLEKRAQQLVQSFTEPFPVQGEPVPLSVSLGISRYPQDAGSAHELLLRADQAMYAVKGSRKNGFQMFDQHGMTSAAR